MRSSRFVAVPDLQLIITRGWRSVAGQVLMLPNADALRQQPITRDFDSSKLTRPKCTAITHAQEVRNTIKLAEGNYYCRFNEYKLYMGHTDYLKRVLTHS